MVLEWLKIEEIMTNYGLFYFWVDCPLIDQRHPNTFSAKVYTQEKNVIDGAAASWTLSKIRF